MRVHVTIDYRTTAGNPASWSGIIDAPGVQEALDQATERVRRFKRCWRIDGGNAVPASDH